VRRPHFKWAALCLTLVMIAVPVEASFGSLHAHTLRGRLLSLASIVAFVLLAGTGVRSLAVQTGRAVRSRADQAAGTTIEITISLVGGPLILLTVLDLLGVTTLLLAGVPVHVVANQLGHSDPEITLRVYAHVMREQAAGVADVFAQAVEDAAVSNSVSKQLRPFSWRSAGLL